MRKNILWMGMLVMALALGMTVAGCDDGTNPTTEPGLSVPDVTQLPDFPADPGPAPTKAAADRVLADLRQTMALNQLEEEIINFIGEYEEDLEDDVNSYSFTNLSIPGARLRVSARGTESESATGGFKRRSDLSDSFDWENGDWQAYQAEAAAIQYAVNDRSNYTRSRRYKGEVTSAKTIDGVIVAGGSTVEYIESISDEQRVTQAGTSKTAQFSESMNQTSQQVIGCTVTTSSGSIKIILGMSLDASGLRNNGEETYNENYSGSLKIYGANNALLITYPFNDYDDWDDALDMIGYYGEPTPPTPPAPSVRNGRHAAKKPAF